MPDFTSRIRASIDLDGGSLFTPLEAFALLVSLDANRGVSTSVSAGDPTGLLNPWETLDPGDIRVDEVENFGTAGGGFFSENFELGYSPNHFSTGVAGIQFNDDPTVVTNAFRLKADASLGFPDKTEGCLIVVYDPTLVPAITSSSNYFNLNTFGVGDRPQFRVRHDTGVNKTIVRLDNANGFSHLTEFNVPFDRTIVAWNWNDSGSADVWVNGLKVAAGAPVWPVGVGIGRGIGEALWIDGINGHLGNLKLFGSRLNDNALIPIMKNLIDRYDVPIASLPNTPSVADYGDVAIQPWADPRNVAGTLPSRLNSLDIPHKFTRTRPGLVQIVAELNGVEVRNDSALGGRLFSSYAAEAAAPVVPIPVVGLSSMQVYDLQTTGHYTIVMSRDGGGAEIHHIEVIP
jgi:hypothetical protein